MSATHIVSREEVMAFLDGEVAPPRAKFVGAHVEGCDECRGIAEALRGLSRAIGEWRVEPAPSTLLPPAVPATLSSAAPKAVSRVLALKWGAVAAVVVLAIGVAEFGRLFGGPWQDLARLPSRAARADATRSAPPAMDALTLPELQAQPRLKDTNGPAAVPSAQKALSSLGYSSSAGARSLQAPPDAPLIVRTASLQLSTDRFDVALGALEDAARRHGGSVSAYQITGAPSVGRMITATVRVPVADVDGALADLHAVGTVDAESRSTEEITEAHRDLTIRIANARREASRLNELLTRQADRLADVLAVEQAQARVQTEIEQMVAEETSMRSRAALASIAVQVHELRRAELALGPQPLAARLRNAAVDGTREAVESLASAAILAVAAAPTMVVWGILAGVPAWILWRVVPSRRARRRGVAGPG
jgi:hypothetical protein